MNPFIGLTGGTGSGKSTVAQVWRDYGAVVIDADQLAREVVAAGSPGLAAVIKRFQPMTGESLLDDDANLRRAALAEIVFADPSALRDLESITHPLIEERTAQLRAAAPPDSIVVHDMPLIVEKGSAENYDVVVVVDAPVELRVQRLIGRGLDEADARRRIAAQASTEERRAVADFWIDNVGSLHELTESARRVWQQLPRAQHHPNRRFGPNA